MMGAKWQETLATQEAVTDGYTELTKWLLAGFNHYVPLPRIRAGLIMTLHLSCEKPDSCSRRVYYLFTTGRHPEPDQSNSHPPIKLFHLFPHISNGFFLRHPPLKTCTHSFLLPDMPPAPPKSIVLQWITLNTMW